ncbi:outer membrane protein assembly factor BamE [Pararhodospirillum oryzae]|uniref:Outer membrane protein assembly factor BamE n=1 Tax=Pararhodospirillum oryzae TaxID=478448 RepID=A0A512H851_9PROT|nr:outer membrane protein assembly factor BamE [Pararhodospirillum oryzae]GEO81621.1 outer membrane protein assembly factor BamE [Pararhodospirillum oryzae]
MKVLPGVILSAGLLLAAGACSHDINAHGNLPAEEALARVQVGEQTRADVQSLLGTPSATALFGGETWYYISNQTTQVAFLAPEEVNRHVVAVHFDANGRVSGVERLTKADGRQVAILQRETPTRGTESTFLQEFFGNLGRFGPSQMGNE